MPIPILGIDIGARFVKIVKLESIQPLEVTDIKIIDTPYTVGEDKEQIDKEKLAEILSQELNKDLTNCKIITCISSSVVKSIYLTFPRMPLKELDEVVPREARARMVPTPPENSIFEYLILEKKEELKLFIASTHRRNLDELLSLYSKIKIPSIITFTSLAHLKLLSSVKTEASDIAFIDIGANSTIISIFRGNRLQIFSSLHPLCSSITSAIINKFELSSTEAEEYLVKSGISEKEVSTPEASSGSGLEESTESGGKKEEDKIDPDELMELIRPRLRIFISEIKRALLYYRERFGGGEIKNIFLIGGGAAIKNIDKFISQNIQGEIKILNPFKEIKLDKISNKLESFSPSIFATSLGLALQNKAETINFLPKEYQKKEVTGVIRYVKKFSLVILGLLVIFFGFLQWRLQRVKKNLLFLHAQRVALLNKLNPYVEKAMKINRRKQSLLRKIEIINKIVMAEPDWEGLLKELTILVPKEVILTDMAIKKISSPARGMQSYGGKGETLPGTKVSSRKNPKLSPWGIEISGYVIADYQTSWLILNQMKSNFENSYYFNNFEISGPKLEKISVSVKKGEGEVKLTEKKKRDFKAKAGIKFSSDNKS